MCGRFSAILVIDAVQGTCSRYCHPAVPLLGGRQPPPRGLQELRPQLTSTGSEKQPLALEGQVSP